MEHIYMNEVYKCKQVFLRYYIASLLYYNDLTSPDLRDPNYRVIVLFFIMRIMYSFELQNGLAL
jgi:hypothetical protein